MSDDELLKRLDFTEKDLADCAAALDYDQRYCEARVVMWCDARIREQRDLLQECERALVAIEEYIEDWQEIEALILIEKTLERLRGKSGK